MTFLKFTTFQAAIDIMSLYSKQGTKQHNKQVALLE